MKIKLYHVLAISILFFSACTDTEVPPNEEEQLKLTYPLIDDDVHYCCFAFEWEDPNKEEFRFQLAKFSSFNNPILDTVITGSSLEFPSFLEPRGSYFWKVTSIESEHSEKSDFRIIDYGAYLSGTYTATIDSYSWLLGEGSTDTTHETSLQIWKGDDHSISYKSDHSNGKMNMPFSGKLRDGYVLYEFDHNGHPSFTDYVKYYFETDSIVTHSESNGNAGGGHLIITALRNN